MSGYGKVTVSLDRKQWRPTSLIEQIVLVTSVSKTGEPHVATKSRISIVTYGPPAVVFFACNAEYRTAKNILDTKQFVLNVPSDNLVATSWVIGSDPSGAGTERFDENGLTRIPGVKTDVVRIAECQTHLECGLLETRAFGPDLAVFGEVLAVTMNQELAEGNEIERYRRLAPFFFLEAGWTASLGTPRLVEEPIPGPYHEQTVLAVNDLRHSTEFYQQVFGWPIRRNDSHYIEFELPCGRGLALCARDKFSDQLGTTADGVKDGVLSGIQLHLYADDLPRIVARLVSSGARAIKELDRDPTDPNYVAQFVDPDGNVLRITARFPAVASTNKNR